MSVCKRKEMGLRATGLVLCAALATLLPGTRSRAQEACFEELSQTFAWDDQGVLWRSMKHCPGEPSPENWAERTKGGRTQVLVSGHDVSVVEESYVWAPHADAPPGQCPVFYRSVTRKTQIAKDGIVYETRKIDDKPAVSSQRPLNGQQYMYVGGIYAVPLPGSPGVQLGAADTIAGRPCQRVTTPSLPGAAVTTFCVFVVPRTCFLAHYLQPLELRTVTPDGVVSALGKTTELRLGKLGEVLPKNAIKAP